MLNKMELIYATAKQLPNARALDTDYGSLELDEEMRAAVEKALRKIIERRINKMMGGRDDE